LFLQVLFDLALIAHLSLSNALSDVQIYLTPEISSSELAKLSRKYYNIFSLPCPSNACYMPNKRFQSLMEAAKRTSPDDELIFREAELTLRSGMLSCDTWQNPLGGSETKISDLNIQHYLSLIVRLAQLDSSDHISLQGGLQKVAKRMAGSGKAESRIVSGNYVMIGNEAKGFDSSQYHAIAQGFQIGADAALALRLEGRLDLDHCAVPVVLGFSDSIQIYGVYLLPESVPVFAPLSSAYSYLTLEGRRCLARSAIALSKFALTTASLLRNRPSLPTNPLQPFILSNSLFFKPIISEFHFHGFETPDKISTQRRSSLDSVMNIYRELSLQEGATNYILFPLGLLSFPEEDLELFSAGRTFIETKLKKFFSLKLGSVKGAYPIIVFDLLPPPWTNTKPPHDHCEAYLSSLEAAVNVMDRGQVVHMDLRPANIMWRVADDGSIEMFIIDFEDALTNGSLFSATKWIASDSRYPFPRPGTVRVSAVHNRWFLVAVSSWARNSQPHAAGVSSDGFTAHMDLNRDTLLGEMGTELEECYVR
jgi:hypothetical protein